MTLQPCGSWLDPATATVSDYASVEALANAIAMRLGAGGAGTAMLAIRALPCALAPAALLAAWHTGRAIVPMRHDATPEAHRALLAQLGTHVLINAVGPHDVRVQDFGVERSLDGWLAAADASAGLPLEWCWQDDEGAAVLSTSGSSGRPKGVVHSQGNVLRAAALFADHFQLHAGDTLACMAPVHTASGLRSLALPLVRNVRVALWERGTGSLAETVESLARLDPGIILCGPQFVTTLAVAGSRLRPLLPGLRRVACTGAMLSEKDRARAMDALGVEILDFYGLTETGGIVLAEPPGAPNPGVLPPACAGVEILLAPDAVQAGIHRLEIAGPNLFLGYLNEPRRRRAVMDTGDLVQRGTDGQLRLAGRSDNAIKAANTEWLFPERLERWFRMQPEVQDAHAAFLPAAEGRAPELQIQVQLANGDRVPDPRDWQRRIAAEIGAEYARVPWVQGPVTRVALGKIEKPCVDTGSGAQ